MNKELVEGLLGKPIFKVYGPVFSVEDGVISSTSLCIPFEKLWMNFFCERVDISDAEGFYKLNVELVDTPKDIMFNSETRELVGASIFLFNRGVAFQNCIKIEIHSKKELLQDRIIEHEFAIILYFQNGVRFCVSVLEDISEQVECSIDDNYIKNILNYSEIERVLI
jgi:hypothetical protein